VISREEYDAIFVMTVFLALITYGVLYLILKKKTSLNKEKVNGFSAAAAIAVGIILFEYKMYFYRELTILDIIYDVGFTFFMYRVTILVVRFKTNDKN